MSVIDMKTLPEDPSAIEALESLARQAVAAGASDIHLQQVGPAVEVHFRLDGLLAFVATLADPLAGRVLGRVKYLARLKTYQDSLPQDGRIAKSDLGVPSDVRVSTYPTVTGEKIVLRFFPTTAVRSLAELSLAPAACVELNRQLRQNAGLILLTGPAGSGKTTTIYACLHELAHLGGRQVITVEDPVEQMIPGIMQTEVNEAAGLSYARAAKHLLRQDPQVLVLGEIRDEETATLAVRAALTGHLVISTLHAGSCRGVFERLLTLCPDRYAVLSSLALVVNQRLMRRLCEVCQGNQCPQCVQTGYHGRLPIAEWFGLTDPDRARIRLNGLETIQPEPTLEQSARELWQQGVSDEKEYRRIMGL